MLELDKKFLTELESAGVQKLKIFLYEAGCSGTKVGVEQEFKLTDDLVKLQTIPSSQPSPLKEKEQVASDTKTAASLSFKGERIQEGGIKIYIPKTDTIHLENARITRTVTADHTGVAKTRYIFVSDEIEERCGCGTSFAFEKKVPKINLEKLRMMRENFKK